MTDPYDDRELPAYLDPRGRGNASKRRRGDQAPAAERHNFGPNDTRVMGTPQRPAAPPASHGQGYYPGQQPDYPPRQPPRQPPPPGGRPKKRRKGLKIFGSVVLVLLLVIVGFGAYLDFSLKRSDVLADYAGRPAATKGTNWLLVGSDGRAGLTAAQKKKLATGSVAGKRTDTIMVLHVPDSGVAPTLVSLPRDTLVDLPGHGKQKLNAAFNFGGGKLLVQTVEQLTNLRIDHYAEVGFGGFASVVDAVGGVDICVDAPINDPKAGLNLQAGCQTLDGAQALGYVRTRATPMADLDRVKHQRKFLAALLSKASGIGTLINPFKSVPMALSAVDSLEVDSGTHLWNLASMGLAMGNGKLVTSTVPISSTPTLSGVGSVVKWDEQGAKGFFGALANDGAVPANLLSK